MRLFTLLLLAGCAARSSGTRAPVSEDPDLAAFFAMTVAPPPGTPASETTAVMGVKVKEKVGVGLALARQYSNVVSTGGGAVPELVKLGQVYEELAASIVHAPAPTSLDPDKAAIFHEILLDQALPLCEQARNAYHFAVRRAGEGGAAEPALAVEALARLQVRADRPMPAEIERIRGIVEKLEPPAPRRDPAPPEANPTAPQEGGLIGILGELDPPVQAPPPPVLSEDERLQQFETRKRQRLDQLSSPEVAACYGARDW